MNPLMKFAILSNNIPAVRKLLDRGELPDAVDKNGNSALMLAAQKGSAELCDMLIHAGADPLMKNKQGKTALTMAEERSHPEAAGILRRAKQTEENTSPASLEEFFSAEDWQEEEPTSPPPEQNEQLAGKAAELMTSIAGFIPKISGEDWSETELELPEELSLSEGRRTLRLAREQIDTLQTIVSKALMDGYFDGSVLDLHFEASGFRDHLVRRMTETLEAHDILILPGPPDEFEKIFVTNDNEPDQGDIEDCHDIFHNFIHAYKDDWNILESYVYDLERYKKIEEDELETLFTRRNKSVWNLIKLLTERPSEIIQLNIFNNIQDQNKYYAIEDEKNDLNDNIKKMISNLDNIKNIVKNSYTDTILFSIMEYMNCDIFSLHDFFNSILCQLKKYQSTLSYESLTWMSAVQLNVRTLTICRNNIVEGNLRLAFYFAQKYRHLGCELSDLIQEAAIGLMKASYRYDAYREAKFSSYAVWWIRQNMFRYIQNSFNTIRIPVHIQDRAYDGEAAFRHDWPETDASDAGYTEVPVWLSRKKLMENLRKMPPVIRIRLDLMPDSRKEAYLADSSLKSSDTESEKNTSLLVLRKLILDAMTILKEKERQVLLLRYVIGMEHVLTLEEIGLKLHVTRERIRQIESKALSKMRIRLRELNIKDCLDD